MSSVSIYLLCLSTIVVAYGEETSPGLKIVGGQNAERGQFPHQISLQYKNIHFCGGSILNAHWILTAAHCFHFQWPLSQLSVRLGTTMWRKGESLAVDQVVIHPDFDFELKQHDLALMRTKKSIKFNSSVGPIALRSSFVGPNEVAVASGWGFTAVDGPKSNILQFLHFKTITNEECVELIPEGDKHSVHNGSLCITQLGEGRGICSGDSGGPLSVDGELVGVASWVSNYCGSADPDVYTRVSPYQKWIEEQVSKKIPS